MAELFSSLSGPSQPSKRSTKELQETRDDEETVRQGEDPEGKQHISCAYYLEDVKGFKEIASKKLLEPSSQWIYQTEAAFSEKLQPGKS